MTPDVTQLPALEESLWRAETRFDRTLMGNLFAPDFFEFGRSGRRYSREEMLFDPRDARDLDATLHGLAVRPLSPEIVLVTYQSEVRHTHGTEWGNRSSIWDRSEGCWRLRFHQGTPIPDGLNP